MASELMPIMSLEVDATIQNLAVSQQVFGRYTLREVLGRGGMGVVWLAYDERLERKVALKFLSEAIDFDPAALDDLKRETQRCLDLTHPNIIRIYDFIKDSQGAAISMEYVDGKTLAKLRVEKERRVFEVAEIAPWVVQACQALHYAHQEAKVVHRDLKPANLMLSSRGQIKVADFGIARSVADSLTLLTMRRGTSGTLGYMSPQQMEGDVPRVTDDVYAMGATIYEFLTGKPPFHSGDIPHQARFSIAPSLRKRRQDFGITGEEIPREWETAVAACLAKVPEQRPGNMLELAERLGLVPGTMRAAPATVVNRPSPRPKFKPSWPPLKHLLTAQRLRRAGLTAGLALVAGPLLYGWARPFLAKPGELVVNSNPPGATVSIPGQADQLTPADYPALRMGRYQVVIAKRGFDAEEQTIALDPGAKINLGSVALRRSTGRLDLVAFPRHARYLLSGEADTADIEKKGSAPDFVDRLPSGAYRLTVSEAGFPSFTGSVQIPPNGTATERIDLVQLAAGAHASPEIAKVLRGEMDAKDLSPQDRSALTGLLGKSFEAYMSQDLFAAAGDQLAKLNAIGANVEEQRARLTSQEAVTERELAVRLAGLVGNGKYATADEKLKNLEDILETDILDRLRSQFEKPLAEYRQQIGQSIAARQNDPPAGACDQLNALAGSYADDLQLQLAIASTRMRMAPEAQSLAAELRGLRQFRAENPDFAAEPALAGMQEKFTDELNELNALAQALADAKEGGSPGSKLAALKEQKAALQKRKVGSERPDIFTKTWNFFGKAVTGHSVVNTAGYFSSEEEKEDAIATVQEQIDREEASLSQPPVSVAEAQKRHDDFVARVPWGQD